MALRQGLMMATRSEVVDAVHEDFTEWTEDAAANVLTVHLPGFRKEQIKVTYDQDPPKMTISGERPVGSNVTSRFSKDFPIPDNCKINEIKAKFDQRQVLTITMPKKTITPVIAQPKDTEQKDQTVCLTKAAITETKPPPKPEEENICLPKSATTATPEKKTDEKVTAPTPSPMAPALPELKTQKETPPEATGQKQADDRVPQPLTTYGDTSRPRCKKAWETTSSKAPLVSEARKPTDDRKSNGPGLKQVDHKVNHQESKSMKEKDQLLCKESSLQVLDRIAKEVGGLAASAKRAVLGLEEERRALVNTGMAVIVIVVVGAYAGYKLGSSSHRRS